MVTGRTRGSIVVVGRGLVGCSDQRLARGSAYKGRRDIAGGSRRGRGRGPGDRPALSGPLLRGGGRGLSGGGARGRRNFSYKERRWTVAWGIEPVARYLRGGDTFRDPSLGEDSAGRDLGGRVFTFESEEDLAKVRDFYEDLAGTSFFFSWVFVEENVLVQINGELPEEGAERYEAVLKEVV